MISLKPVVEDRTQEEIIFRKIKAYFDDLLFSFLEEVLKEPLENATDINWYLKRGYLRYEDGYFIPRGKLPNKISKELEKLGAKWSRAKKAYFLKPQKVPVEISQTIAEVNIHNQEKVERIEQYLQGVEENLPVIKLDFDKEVVKIGSMLDNQFKKSLGKINIIPADMTDFQKSEIAEKYTNNLDFYIKKWTSKEIVKLREDIQPLVLSGYRASSLEDIIQKHKNVSARKAKFLARQETKLLVSQYQENRFKEAGVTHYRWQTILDGRERDLHRQLNGQVFAWDEPPIIDARTGERGNPGQAYNCRCKAIPIVDM